MNKTILSIFICGFFTLQSCKDDSGNVTADIVTSAKPNILLVIADDVGIEATPGYNIGTLKPKMPNLQKLTSEGIIFDNVWSYPVCSPTRASIITGKYGYNSGVLNVTTDAKLSNGEKTLHAYLDDKSSGYAHAVFGKWHLSGNDASGPTSLGVGHYTGLLSGAVQDYNSWSLTENGHTNSYNGYVTTKITDMAIDWTGQQSKPWFCWVAYTAPHTPFHLPPDSMHSQGALASDQASIDANPLPYFMAMTESVDFELGRILNSMTDAEKENTIIIYIGDNGTHGKVTQSPYVLGRVKGSLYQGGIHVPMVIAGAGISRTNEREPSLIQTADLFTTIAEITGLELESYENSISFKPLLTNAGESIRKFNYSEIKDDNTAKSGYTIRNSQYKLIRFENDRELFYDLSEDAYEGSNLLQNALTAEQQAAYDALLAEAKNIRK